MASPAISWLPRKWHYAWVIVGVCFAVAVMTAGVRSTPGVLIVPLEDEFGWSRATISFALGINLLLFGAIGPFAAAVMDRFGARRTITLALAVTAASVALTPAMSQPWQLVLLWGVVVGLSTGFVGGFLAAYIAGRWFRAREGFVVGLLTAANAAGQLVFLPTMASLVTHSGWRIMSLVLAAAVVVFLPVPALLMRNRPGDVGLRPYGDLGASRLDASPKGNPVMVAFRALAMGARSRDFWLIAGGYLVCGATTNGLIGTHLIAACVDHGLSEVAGAGLLAATGIFALLGGTLAGWLSDRWDNRFCCAPTMDFAAFRCCISRSPSICRSMVCRYSVSYMASIGLPVLPRPCACSRALSAPRRLGSWWHGLPSSIRSAARRRHTWLASCVSRSAPIWKPSSSRVSC
jgi:MFS family permease